MHFKMYKAPQLRSTLRSCDVEKGHAVVARSTFASQNVQSTKASDHVWKLRCRKSPRRFCAEHIWKWTCSKHTMFGPLLEVEMSKKCTPLRRKAHFESKCENHHMFGPCMDVQMLSRCRKSARCGAKHMSKSNVLKTDVFIYVLLSLFWGVSKVTSLTQELTTNN